MLGDITSFIYPLLDKEMFRDVTTMRDSFEFENTQSEVPRAFREQFNHTQKQDKNCHSPCRREIMPVHITKYGSQDLPRTPALQTFLDSLTPTIHTF